MKEGRKGDRESEQEMNRGGADLHAQHTGAKKRATAQESNRATEPERRGGHMGADSLSIRVVRILTGRVFADPTRTSRPNR